MSRPVHSLIQPVIPPPPPPLPPLPPAQRRQSLPLSHRVAEARPRAGRRPRRLDAVELPPHARIRPGPPAGMSSAPRSLLHVFATLDELRPLHRLIYASARRCQANSWVFQVCRKDTADQLRRRPQTGQIVTPEFGHYSGLQTMPGESKMRGPTGVLRSRFRYGLAPGIVCRGVTAC